MGMTIFNLKIFHALKVIRNFYQYFLFKNLIKIPYNFEGMNNFEIKYNHGETAFELYTLKDICLENYQSLRIDLKFSFLVDQMVIFEQNQNLSVIAIDTAPH